LGGQLVRRRVRPRRVGFGHRGTVDRTGMEWKPKIQSGRGQPHSKTLARNGRSFWSAPVPWRFPIEVIAAPKAAGDSRAPNRALAVRTSDFELLSDFDPRISDFTPPPSRTVPCRVTAPTSTKPLSPLVCHDVTGLAPFSHIYTDTHPIS
jgi:hypothetical protein